MAEREKPLLLLIDGMALAYRSYFAFISRPLTNSKGQNTSAVFGFMTGLHQALEMHKPDYAAVCFDTPQPTFRHEMYKEYKATREAMPEDMRPQIKEIKELTQAYKIPLLELSGYEADDLIGTLSLMADKNKIETVIITPDKDFCQLVSKHVKLLRPKDANTLDLMDEKAVEEKYGLKPEQFIDYLALVGDTSDNIPGVKGVGEKTATPLIQEYGDLDGVYTHLDKITKKALKEKLTNDKENAYLSRTLATIKRDVPVDVTLDDLKYTKLPDFRKVEAMLMDLGFKSLLAKLHAEEKIFLGNEAPSALAPHSEPAAETPQVQDRGAVKTIRSVKHEYQTILGLKELRSLVSKLKTAKELCFDLETTSSNAMRAIPIGISFSVTPHEAYYIPLKLETPPSDLSSLFGENTKGEPAEANATNTGLAATDVFALLKPILESQRINKVGQNIKYDALVLRKYDIKVTPITFDTMIASSLLQSDGLLSMDDLSLHYLNYQPVPLSDIAGKLKKETSAEVMAAVDTHQLAEYGAEDSDITLQLKHAIRKEIESKQLTKIANFIEFPLIEVLTAVEYNGVKIDTKLLAEVSKEMEREAHAVCNSIYKHAGEQFNIDSTKQLGEILFKKMGLPPVKKTKTGYSTDASVLEQLKAHHPIAEDILNYRQYQKLRGTYVDALPTMVNPDTGLVHTSYNQAVAATGRLSSNDPNLQNIPVRTEMGRGLRKAFVSRFKGGQIFSADYSQIELRIMAHMAKDDGLIRAFANSEDIHTQTSARVFGVKLEDVTRDMRRKAKEVNYGIMYGIGAFGLSTRLGISQKEGSEIIRSYFAAFPSIKDFIDSTIAFAKHTGYVQTLLGRRRYMSNINASNQTVRAADERAAINMPIQGTAAEMMKLAMITIQRELERRKMKSLMIMQVHDELVFDVYPGEKDDVKEIVEYRMQHALPMAVPLEVDSGFGATWFDAH
ncbi:MAG: DNA polymerase I [Bacteroidetes bacterium]|nr:DNA polymerase I [Bacteroidota bacterium]